MTIAPAKNLQRNLPPTIWASSNGLDFPVRAKVSAYTLRGCSVQLDPSQRPSPKPSAPHWMNPPPQPRPLMNQSIAVEPGKWSDTKWKIRDLTEASYGFPNSMYRSFFMFLSFLTSQQLDMYNTNRIPYPVSQPPTASQLATNPSRIERQWLQPVVHAVPSQRPNARHPTKTPAARQHVSVAEWSA